MDFSRCKRACYTVNLSTPFLPKLYSQMAFPVLAKKILGSLTFLFISFFLFEMKKTFHRLFIPLTRIHLFWRKSKNPPSSPPTFGHRDRFPLSKHTPSKRFSFIIIESMAGAGGALRSQEKQKDFSTSISYLPVCSGWLQKKRGGLLLRSPRNLFLPEELFSRKTGKSKEH